MYYYQDIIYQDIQIGENNGTKCFKDNVNNQKELKIFVVKSNVSSNNILVHSETFTKIIIFRKI